MKKRVLNRAQRSLILIAFMCVGGILIVNWLSIDQNLKYSLIAEIVGSGIVAALISYFFFELQNANEYEASKNRAESYYKKKALPDVQEVFETEQSIAWSIDLGKDFYLSASLINPLHQAYEANFDVVVDYQSYFPNDVLLGNMDALYMLTRKAYVQGALLDNNLRRLIRVEHHKLSVNQMNDSRMLQYLKAKLFAGVSDEEIIQYLDWDSIPDRAVAMFAIAQANEEIEARLQVLQSLRESALKLTEVVKGLKDE